MSKFACIAVIVLFTVASCKKNRQCECKNASGTYPAGEVEATRHQAKKFCKDLSEPSTECYLN